MEIKDFGKFAVPLGVLDPGHQSLSPFGSVFFVSYEVRYLGQAPGLRKYNHCHRIDEDRSSFGAPAALLWTSLGLFLASL